MANTALTVALLAAVLGACDSGRGTVHSTVSTRTRRAVRVKVDGKVLVTKPAPTIRGGRVYVPITAFRKMGLYVEWKRGDRRGTIAWPETDLIYEVAANRSWVPGQVAGSKEPLIGTPFVAGDQLMVPLRTPVMDTPSHRSFQMEWDAGNRVAHVRRSEAWLQWRLRNDADLKAAKPGSYETPM